jgi:hypothetical protein
LFEIRRICQMLASPTSRAIAMATPNAPKMRVDTLRRRIAVSRFGNPGVGKRM